MPQCSYCNDNGKDTADIDCDCQPTPTLETVKHVLQAVWKLAFSGMSMTAQGQLHMDREAKEFVEGFGRKRAKSWKPAEKAAFWTKVVSTYRA
jgi:hypothetical protein